MKTKIISSLFLFGWIISFSGCIKEGPAGRDGIDGIDGRDGNANVIYSPWYTPNAWNGSTGDWYFQVASSQISEDVVEAGVVLAYMSVPDDIYEAAVRPMPAYAAGANWDFLLPYYGAIEFTCDALNMPGTSGHYFRFVIIPSNITLKSSVSASYTAEELKKMSYSEVCRIYGIPE